MLRVAFVLAVSVSCPCSARALEPEPHPSAAEQTPALSAPQLIEAVAPKLPELPEGSEPIAVVLELTIDKNGLPSDPVVLGSGGGELDRAALSASTELRFRPATRDNEPISARIPFRFEFRAAQPAALPAPQRVASATAQERSSESAELTLEVQGEKPPREPTMHTLDIVEARKLPGTNGDPLRAIEALPGVARPSALDTQLIVRGSSPNDSGIFIDGIQIPVAYHLGGQASIVQNDALGSIAFTPGNFGPEYGRGMGGVVELGLRAPRRDRFAGFVQLDSVDGRLLLEGPLGKRTRLMIAARRSWVDAWLGSVDKDFTNAPVYYDGQAVLEHDLNKRTTARLFFIGSDDHMRLYSAAPSGTDPGAGGRFSQGTRFARLGLRTDTKFGEDLTLRNTLSWGTDQYDVALGGLYQKIHANQLAARSELRAHFGRWVSGTLGVDAQFGSYDVKLRLPPFQATDQAAGPLFAQPPRTMAEDNVWVTRPALYALLELKPSDGLRIVPSVRADYARDTKQLTLDPRISARGDVHPSFPRTTLKGGVGFYSQAPQPVESVLPFGSPGVKSNRALHVSAGVEQELARGLELSVEGFYKYLTKLVVAQTAEDQSNVGVKFANTGSGRIYGGETLLRYRDPKGRYFGWVAYTLMRSERKNEPSEPYHLFQYDQTHILTALANVQLGRGFSIGGRFRYVTGSPFTPDVGGVVDLDAGAYAPIAGKPYGARLPAFQQLDLRVDKAWQLGPTKLTAYLELRNAYNRKNAEAVAYRFDYSKSERVSGFPILPVLGLRGEL